jgi:hypothetical protein
LTIAFACALPVALVFTIVLELRYQFTCFLARIFISHDPINLARTATEHTSFIAVSMVVFVAYQAADLGLTELQKVIHDGVCASFWILSLLLLTKREYFDFKTARLKYRSYFRPRIFFVINLVVFLLNYERILKIAAALLPEGSEVTQETFSGLFGWSLIASIVFSFIWRLLMWICGIVLDSLFHRGHSIKHSWDKVVTIGYGKHLIDAFHLLLRIRTFHF